MAQLSPKSRETGIPAALLQLFLDFDASGLRWCLLRPWQGLYSPEGDIDVLLSPDEFSKARAILLRAGYVPIYEPGSDLQAVDFDSASGRFLWVHVQSTLKIGDLTVPAQALLPDIRRTRFPEVAPEWLLWTLLVRAIEKQCVPERYRSRLRQLASEWSGGPAEVETLARDRGLDPDALVAAAAAGDWQSIARQKWSHSETPDNRARRVIRLARRGWRVLIGFASAKRRGLCVAVIGPDGAGKSTLVQALERELPLRTRRVYMGLTGGRMRRAASLKVPGIVFAAQCMVLWARYLRAQLYCAAGQIILFDRYVLDGAVPAGRVIPFRAQVARRVQRWIVPAPDLVLLLDASGRTMYARKGEYAPETLESWRAEYRKLKAGVPIELLDAEQPPESVLRSAETLIWKMLRERASR